MNAAVLVVEDRRSLAEMLAETLRKEGYEVELVMRGDVAVEMTVLRVDETRELALCEADDGRRQTVETALVAPVRPAERLLVHAGTAIARAGGVP